VRTCLSRVERALCSRVGEQCRRDGVALVGLDLIGGYLIEVNVTCTAGFAAINRVDGGRIEAKILSWLEGKIVGSARIRAERYAGVA
jgi:glutathione synthase